ncbi:M23 family metallopeptidase [Ramlibacter alkalitolerans]|uniref:M23 family metallopeptidase n=1 Tax=Ramlibacter alkalitolerans TaxID=2039631 RepID=A0ABS1JQ59_9BURK|nr:M23 family metallopeptidase [Ramlibacter alkalitolerans]MBL0426382.1 M23 family metallopeptidase [Ramlibacter alkalitolerans]
MRWPAAVLRGLLLVFLPVPALPQALSLALPIQCRPGVDCEIQNYVDRDPGPGARDYQCGSRSYQGHDGVDFRLPDLARQREGVAVLAAADGEVARLRDGVADVSVRATGTSAVEGRECGNGVVLRHEAGFETQYCHLARGSIAVRVGQRVSAGHVLGRVGLSGRTEYPHLHFTVRRGRSLVDPFAHGAPPGTCQPGQSLWQPALREALAYKARSVLNTGFSARALAIEAIDEGPELPTPQSAALLAYARAIGLKAGDVQTITLKAPDGAVLASSTAQPLPRDQAQSMVFAGVRRPATGWPRGQYRGEYVVRRDGQEVLARNFAFSL